MAVAFDASSFKLSTGSGDRTLSHVVGSGTNRILVVGISGDNIPATACTYGGVAMTQIDVTSSTNSRFAQMWYLIDPATGTANIEITKPNNQCVIFGASFSSTTLPLAIGATNKLYTGSGTDGTLSLTPVGTSGYVVDAIATNDTAINANSGQTVITQAGEGGEDWCGAYRTHAGAATASDWINIGTSVIAHLIAEVYEAVPPVNPSVTDNVTITESVTMMVDDNPNVFDGVTVSEAVTMMVDLNINVFDGVTITEAVTVEVEAPIIEDTVTVTEFVSILILELVPAISDDVTVTEAVTMEMSLDISVFDSVAVTESVAGEQINGFISADDVTVSESVTMMMDLNVSVFDSITVTEPVTAIVAAAKDGLIRLRSSEQSYPLMMDDDENR